MDWLQNGISSFNCNLHVYHANMYVPFAQGAFALSDARKRLELKELKVVLRNPTHFTPNVSFTEVGFWYAP